MVGFNQTLVSGLDSGPQVVVEILETSPFNYNITCSIRTSQNTASAVSSSGTAQGGPVSAAEIVSVNWLFNDSYDFPR